MKAGMARSDSVQAVVERMLAQLRGWPDLQGAAIWLPEEGLLMLVEMGAEGACLQRVEREPALDGLLARAWSAGTVQPAGGSLLGGGGQADPPWVSRAASLIATPLRLDGERLGALALGGQQAWPTAEVEALAGQMAVAIQAARDNAALKLALAQANEASVQFVSIVAHELRTPMTSIKGYTDMLLSGMAGELAETQRKFLGTIKLNADRLGALISDVLEVSRLDAGRIRLDPAPLALDEAVREAIGALRGQMEAKRLTCDVALPDALRPAWADRSRVVQIMSELLGNACMYTPEGGAIRIAARPWPEGDKPSHLQIDVADSGVGIAEEEQPKVFQRFFRADDPVVREQIGAGLGLCIVQGLVELHGGQVWFHSARGQGCTFSFTLPFADAPMGG